MEVMPTVSNFTVNAQGQLTGVAKRIISITLIKLQIW